MSEALLPIAGVIVGFFLSEGSQYMKTRTKSRRNESAARRLISSEIGSNINLIKEFQSISTEFLEDIQNQDYDFYDEHIQNQCGREIAKLPIPAFSSTYFHSQLTQLGLALPAKDIENAFKHYKYIQQLNNWFVALHLAWDSTSSSTGFTEGANAIFSLMSLNESMSRLASEINILMNLLVDDGNPFEQDGSEA